MIFRIFLTIIFSIGILSAMIDVSKDKKIGINLLQIICNLVIIYGLFNWL